MSAPFIVRGVVLVGAALVTGLLAYFAYRNAANNENAQQNHPHENGPPPPRPPGRNTELKNKCTVCLKEINPRDREFLKCNHMFHHDCYVDMLLKGERHCPRCFRRITESELNAVLGGVEYLRDKCSICLEPISNHDIKILNCDHQVHDDCFNDLIENGGRNCPTCRRSIPQCEVRDVLMRRQGRRPRRMETH